MPRRLMVPLLSLAWIVLSAASCPSKEQCTGKYSVADLFTKDECKTAYNLQDVPPEPVPGPKIILKKDAAGTYRTYVDYGGGEVLQAAGSLAYDTGTIRSDFTGTAINALTATSTTSAVYSNANYIAFQKTVAGHVYKIELVRTAGDKARWYASKDGGGRKVLTATGTWTENEVPGEFSEFDPATFYEVIEDVALDNVNYFRVNQ